MPATRKSAKAAKPAPLAVPEPAPSSTGHARKLTEKQKEIAATDLSKATAAQKRVFVADLRAEQAQEERRGFTRPTVSTARQNNDDNDDYEEEGFFSSVTIPPPTKITISNGRRLVHCYSGKENNGPQASDDYQPTGRPLVRRVPGASRPEPLTMEPNVVASPFINLQDPSSRGSSTSMPRKETTMPRPGPYTPHVQAYYQRPDCSIYTRDWPIPQNAEYSDDEFGVGNCTTEFEEPTCYHYTNVHPDLEAFPISERRERESTSQCQEHYSSQPKTSHHGQDSSLGVRKDPPSTCSPETTVVVKIAKTGTTGSRGRVRASDLDDFSKNILEDGIGGYKAHVSTINPYPTRDEEHEWAGAVWVSACQDHGVQMEFDEDILELITARASQARGQLKTLCRPLTESFYGLTGENGKCANRDKIEDLLERSAFLYKDCAGRTGMYRHPIIQVLTNKMWFKNKTDDGVIYKEYFSSDGIPLVTIAFVLTAVECCLDEWQSGEPQDIPFSASGYQEKFKEHLRTLQNFEANTKDANIVPHLLKHILKTGRKHAKVDAVTASCAIQLADEDFEAAKKEWTDLVLLEDED